MGVGTAIRHRLGRFEVPAAEAYRAVFISLDRLAGQIATQFDGRLDGHPTEPAGPCRILEIGCGDGALARRLVRTFPSASYLGIDPAPTAGRLYRGDPARAEFRCRTSAQLVAEAREPFDLVVLVDVLHHIPGPQRPAVLREAARLTALDGLLLVKEWELGRWFFGRLAYWADRYVTGDTQVDFMTGPGLRQLLATAAPEFEVQRQERVRPWRENVLLTLSRAGADPRAGSMAE